MTNAWALSALWVGLALVATLFAIWFKVLTAISETVVGTVAELVIGVVLGTSGLQGNRQWITFLAGAELDPAIFKIKWREAMIVGLAGFFGPFLGCTAIARFMLHRSIMSSWLAGVALSTASVAVVYAVMLEPGFNVTEYGKSILAACFINDLGTVIALGLIFSPFTIRTLIFVGVSAASFAVIPFLAPWFSKNTTDPFQKMQASVIVMGERSYTILHRWMIGSVMIVH